MDYDDFHEVDDEGYVNVWTDGACSANGQHGARAGYGVWWGEDHHMNSSRPVQGRPTNNNAEIQAASWAMMQALDHDIDRIIINTNSQFLINVVTQWMPRWKRNGWRTYLGEAVRNQRYLRRLDNLQRQLDVGWRYVEAHSGNYGNIMSGQLARAAVRLYQ